MPKKSKAARPKPLYRTKPPKVGTHSTASQISSRNIGDAVERIPTDDLLHAHVLAHAHFTLRDDGTIQTERGSDQRPGRSMPAVETSLESSNDLRSEAPGAAHTAAPRLLFQSDAPFIRLYHGNSLELLDAIAAKYPEGRFDCIFADPPYFLSNGGITCHAGKMVKVDKGDWDKSRGPELNHEFNLEWLHRCQRVLKPDGTIWVSGTLHVIFSIGYAMKQLGFKILNDIAWEKPNPPPNLSCRYFTHSTETILWGAKNEKSKHLFNYQAMRKVTGKQMKTVWRKDEFPEGRAMRVPNQNDSEESGTRVTRPSDDEASSIWTMSAPGSDEKEHGKHPTQKPVALIERCLLAATHEGDLVLDPFLGGGTTAVACVRLKRGCVGIELSETHLTLAMKRADVEIMELWLREFHVAFAVAIFLQNDLDPDGRSMDRINWMKDGEPKTDCIFHETKFVFLSCAAVSSASVIHTTVETSLQEAWAKTPNGKRRETTHIVRCQTEILRVKSS